MQTARHEGDRGGQVVQAGPATQNRPECRQLLLFNMEMLYSLFTGMQWPSLADEAPYPVLSGGDVALGAHEIGGAKGGAAMEKEELEHVQALLPANDTPALVRSHAKCFVSALLTHALG